jgi:hypothetical protein
MAKRERLTFDAAERLALQGLTFLASDPQRLGRFLSLTGIGLEELRNWEANHDLQSAVLEHLLADEGMLLVFAAEAGLSPDQVAPAQQLLSGST